MGADIGYHCEYEYDCDSVECEYDYENGAPPFHEYGYEYLCTNVVTSRLSFERNCPTPMPCRLLSL